ncbi:MAG: hypothetical protein SGJ04_06660 [Bacteroidota bacterium]|nr:hypothetical protein [Bacteroidota bacterium]
MRYILILCCAVLTTVFTACGSRVNNAEELAIPIINAIRSENANALKSMLPSQKELASIYSANPEQLGYVYYNKYSSDYRKEYFEGKMTVSMDIIKTISKNEDLDWSAVEYSRPVKKDINDSGKSFTLVTIPLHFPKGDFDLTYNAVKENNRWFILEDVDIKKHEAGK